jgi:DinB superfamily
MMKRIAILVLLAVTCCAYAQDKNAPTTLKGVLLEQLKTTHNQKEWFVPVDIAVDGLTADQANWTDGKGNHSIAQEVSHLLFWDAWALAKFKGEPQPKFSGNNDDTFTSVDSKQWVATCKKLDDILTEWEQAVQAADDKKIAASASMIAHVGTHNAYHIGQIVYIRKLQGSWDAGKGVH